jgi:hypothetical protein
MLDQECQPKVANIYYIYGDICVGTTIYGGRQSVNYNIIIQEELRKSMKIEPSASLEQDQKFKKALASVLSASPKQIRDSRVQAKREKPSLHMRYTSHPLFFFYGLVCGGWGRNSVAKRPSGERGVAGLGCGAV